MKRLFSVLVLLLALNGLGAAGYVGWLVRSGSLDRQKFDAIRQIIFPVPLAVVPTTQPVVTVPPPLKLEELLAQYAGRPPVEQLAYIREAFDAQMAQLDRAQREMLALKAQAESAQAAAQRERQTLEHDQQKFQASQRSAAQLATDKGFQDSLALYSTLPAKQVKTLVMGLEVETAVQYLQEMEPRAAARITKEFKSADETERLKTILARMRAPALQAVASP
jgi:hypothetical protein